MRLPLLLALGLLLAGCTALPRWPGQAPADQAAPAAPLAPPVGAAAPVAPAATPTVPAREATDTCGAAVFRHLIGQPSPEPFPAPPPLRVFRSGDALTMDHRPERLNVELERHGERILAVYCG